MVDLFELGVEMIADKPAITPEERRELADLAVACKGPMPARKPSAEVNDSIAADKYLHSLPGEMPLTEAAERMQRFEGAQQAKREAQFRQFDKLVTSPIFNDYCAAYDIELRRRYGGAPRDLYAEQAIFAAPFMPEGSEAAIEAIVRRLRPWHLSYQSVHVPVLMAIAAIYQRFRGEAAKVDIVTVTSELRRMGALATAENPMPNSPGITPDYLMAILQRFPNRDGAMNIHVYIDAVIETAQLRALARLGERLSDLALSQRLPPTQLVNFLRKAADVIEQGKGTPDFDALLEQTK